MASRRSNHWLMHLLLAITGMWLILGSVTAQDAAPQTPPRAATMETIYGQAIAAVESITVETPVGCLPRLPATVRSQGADGTPGPEVRVIWPAPRDNESVRQAGAYTLEGRLPGLPFAAGAHVRVVDAGNDAAHGPPLRLRSFPLGDVTLQPNLDGRPTPFLRNRDKFLRGLAESNPDRFLYMFRNAFGMPQPEEATPLGVWDSQTTRLRGHATGHYLSAIAQAYASTGYDPELQDNFRGKMSYLIDTLYDLSQKSGRPREEGGPYHADPATLPPGPGRTGYDSDLTEQGIRTDYWNWGVGFISAYPPDQFVMLEQGAAYGGNNHQIWAPYYTLHKILAGLLDCYEYGASDKALKIASDMSLWVFERLRRVPPETRISMWNRYIAGEYGGMNDVLARLHRLTEDPRFLECARLFDNTEFFFGDAQRTHGLARNVDTLRGKHANQHIPQVTGALEVFRVTHDPLYYRVADNFWHICTRSYMYAIGGVAGASQPKNAECFTAEPDTLFTNGFSADGQNETCATYNLLKLSRGLFAFCADARYMDYYEQALYNHILASVAEDHPGNTYHVPLNPGSRKQFGNAAMDGFTCCNGTALESHTKLQDSIYFSSQDGQQLYVNLFIPSALVWRERGIRLVQETNFPYADRTRLRIEGGGEFELRIRIPQWVGEGPQLWLNGQEQMLPLDAGSYVSLERAWQPGDVVELRLPFSFRLHRVMDQPRLASIFFGPVLLAVEEPAALSDWRQVRLPRDGWPSSFQGSPEELRFQLGELRLKPFFETYGRYSIYLDVVLH